MVQGALRFYAKTVRPSACLTCCSPARRNISEHHGLQSLKSCSQGQWFEPLGWCWRLKNHLIFEHMMLEGLGEYGELWVDSYSTSSLNTRTPSQSQIPGADFPRSGVKHPSQDHCVRSLIDKECYFAWQLATGTLHQGTCKNLPCFGGSKQTHFPNSDASGTNVILSAWNWCQIDVAMGLDLLLEACLIIIHLKLGCRCQISQSCISKGSLELISGMPTRVITVSGWHDPYPLKSLWRQTLACPLHNGSGGWNQPAVMGFSWFFTSLGPKAQQAHLSMGLKGNLKETMVLIPKSKAFPHIWPYNIIYYRHGLGQHRPTSINNRQVPKPTTYSRWCGGVLTGMDQKSETHQTTHLDQTESIRILNPPVFGLQNFWNIPSGGIANNWPRPLWHIEITQMRQSPHCLPFPVWARSCPPSESNLPNPH